MELSSIYFKKRKAHYEVCLYYTKNKVQRYYSTGVTIEPKYFLPKSKSISTQHPKFVEVSRKIRDKHEEFEKLLRSLQNEFGEKPTVEIVEFNLNKSSTQKVEKANSNYKDILDYYEDFLTWKDDFVVNTKSISKYRNLRDALTKFRDIKNVSLQFKNIDRDFLYAFVDFLLNEKVDSRKIKDVKKGLSNNSALDALKIFLEFLNYVVLIKKINFNVTLFQFDLKVVKKKLKLKKTETFKVVLNKKELTHLVNFPILEPKLYDNFTAAQKFYMGFYLFGVLQGTAYVDTRKITRDTIKNGKIIDNRQKTGNKFIVDLNPVSKEILELYNYDLTQFIDPETKKSYKVTDVRCNIALKQIFRVFYRWYADLYEKETGKKYQLEFTIKRNRGLNADVEVLNKWDLITTHTARASFVSILAKDNGNEAGLKNIMVSTGQTGLSTVLGYNYLDENDPTLMIDIERVKK